jgi:hypothetical protein
MILPAELEVRETVDVCPVAELVYVTWYVVEGVNPCSVMVPVALAQFTGSEEREPVMTGVGLTTTFVINEVDVQLMADGAG